MNKKIIIGVVLLIILVIVMLRACSTGQQDEPAEQVIVVDEPVVEEIQEEPEEVYVKADNASPITGLPCEYFDKRPLAIMYSGDIETRPYFSGISEAGFVVEMAHRYTHGGTRVMGIFDCTRPEFVGPMRSGRVEFLNVAGAFDAIFVPWGGDNNVKDLLKKGAHDHIECNGEVAPGGGSACFRRPTSVVPLAGEDRAFSSAQSLQQRAENVGYSTAATFSGYQHEGDIPKAERPANGTLRVGFQGNFAVRYEYNSENNSYERFFRGNAEHDFNTKARVAPKNIIIIKTAKNTFPPKQYPNFALGDAWFDTVRSGAATFFLNGQEVTGTWKKANSVTAPFEFFDANGNEMVFAPGQIWLEVMEPQRSFEWTTS